ncbi:probable cytochrome P450 313a4 [Wyeomyia smithii]|uniref:probable cytochrome P450 313a4 n=1 Tax=Wyeomyia smithii TaxID=174621 RepID=UPI002467B40F|nr:probable cytochrome P450 313a4 [Wyeomyia smithii]
MKNPAKLFKIWIGPISFIGTSDPDVIQGILPHTHCIQKPYIYEFFKIDFGLFAAPPNVWKVQRKALNPSFNHKILYRFFPIFDRFAQKLVESLLQIPEDCEVQITKYMTRCTLAMVCATTIGSDIDKDHDTEKFAYNMNGILELVAKRCLNLFTCSESIYKLTEASKLEESMRQYAWEFVDKGSDTTGIAMGFIAQLLGIYPHLQEKVYQEISEVFPPASKSHFTSDNLGQLQYTEMFIEESLRHFTIVPIILRQTTSDIELDGALIPTGTSFALNIYNLLRREDVWGPSAKQFDPENFSGENINKRHPFAFLPFSGGNRNCIGHRYAMMSLKIMVVHLLKSFELKSNVSLIDLKFKIDSVLKFSNEPGLILERRKSLPIK